MTRKFTLEEVNLLVAGIDVASGAGMIPSLLRGIGAGIEPWKGAAAGTPGFGSLAGPCSGAGALLD